MPQKESLEQQLSPTRIPDLSLNIRPPNSAPSSICTGQNDTESEGWAFDIWRKDEEAGGGGLIRSSHSDSSIRATSPLADTELSLATTTSEAESPWRRRMNSFSSQEGDESATMRFMINHGFSKLEVPNCSEKEVQPIKGIPVYNACAFPFSPLDESSRLRSDGSKFCFHEMPYSPSSSSPAASFYNKPYSNCINGITMETLSSTRPYPHRHQQQQPFQYLNNHSPNHYHNPQFGIGSSDLSNAFRLRYMPKLQNKRNMRAPRMRWTSSLHARFVHAVELLGGHESTN